HRFNADGSFDSICTLCLETVATAKIEAELSRHERVHVCNAIRMYQAAEDQLAARRLLSKTSAAA
ncbi:MAG: hypothetical protein ABR928_21325, partial [Terracidiphilus sp.]